MSKDKFDPHALTKELRLIAESWRHSHHDPSLVSALVFALHEVANAIVRVYGPPPEA